MQLAARFVSGDHFEKHLVTTHPEAGEWTVTVIGTAGTRVPAPRVPAGREISRWHPLREHATAWLVDRHLLPAREKPWAVEVSGRGWPDPVSLVHPSRGLRVT